MKWTLHPTDKELTTSLPLTIEIRGTKGIPLVKISELGKMELRPQRDGSFKTEFYLSLPGEYTVVVSDSEVQHVRKILISEHRYLDFIHEFGFFFILFLLVMGGIILWVRSLMNGKTT